MRKEYCCEEHATRFWRVKWSKFIMSEGFRVEVDLSTLLLKKSSIRKRIVICLIYDIGKRKM